MVKITFARKRWNNSRYKLQNNAQHWAAVCDRLMPFVYQRADVHCRKAELQLSTTSIILHRRRVRSAYDVAWAFGLVSELLLLQNTHSYITKYLIGKVSTINRQTKQGVTKYSNVEYTYCFNLLHPHVFKNKAVMQGWKHRTEVTL